MQTLCLDFGTSSLRAAVSREGEIVPLAIAPGSPMDNASIPSAMFIPASGAEVCFGIEALNRGQTSNNARLLELSPKTWLSPGQVENIDEAVVADLPFTRRDLIGALLVLALQETLKSASLSSSAPGSFELRISHPAWPTADYVSLSRIYDSFRRFALANVSAGVKPVMNSSEFAIWCSRKLGPGPAVDVKEPIAAAIAVYEDVDPNTRSAILVVDIGAGTIDLGIFASVVPDLRAAAPRRLLELTKSMSMFGAGDVIDQELISVFNERGQLNSTQQTSLRNNIRDTKKNVFNSGQAAFGAVVVTISELTQRPRMIEMALDLERAVAGMINAARGLIEAHARATIHRLDTFHVIFAGGGAKVEFLQVAVQNAVNASGLPVTVRFHIPVTPRGFPVEAEKARMAVAIGGAIDASLWPETAWREPALRRGLAPPVR